MLKLIIGIAILLGGLWLLGVIWQVFNDFLDASRQQWDRTRPGRERVGSAIAQPIGEISATVSDHRLMSGGLLIVLLIGTIVLAGADSAGLIAFVDGIGGLQMPLLGWAILGVIAGIFMGFGSRVLELGWLGISSISRVPDIRHLRDGEAAAVRHFRVRMAVAGVGAVFLAILLTLGYSRNAGYDSTADYGKKAVAISSAATEGKITILNAALDDAIGRLQSDPKSGLKILLVLTALSGNSVSPEVERVAKISRKYLEAFRDETERYVTEGKPEALARSEAFLDVNRIVAVNWLGRLYESGKGGAIKDLAKAFAFYGEAASKGDKTAAAMMGKVAHIMISSKDETSRMEAFKYLEPKAQQGGPHDHYWFGKWYAASGKLEDQRNVEKWLAKALVQDDDASVKNMAFSAFVQLKGVSPTATKILDEQSPKFIKGKDEGMKKVAYAYIEQRANEEDPGAMLWMGFRFAEGDGTPKDEKKAHDWFLKAALQNVNQRVKDAALSQLGRLQGKEKNQTASAKRLPTEGKANSSIDRRSLTTSDNVENIQQRKTVATEGHDRKILAVPPNARPMSSSLDIDATNKKITIPANSAPNQYVAQGWSCSAPQYKQVGNQCQYVEKPANSIHNQYVPQGWSCSAPQYKQIGDQCQYVEKPANSIHNQYVPQGWSCSAPQYKQIGDQCQYVEKPANSIHNQYVPQGWSCNTPAYKQVGNECWKLEVGR
jgi:TPR repeat protein